MKNFRLWRLLRRLKPGIPRDRKARERRAEEARREAWGEITETTRAEDRQRLADAVAGKADRLI